MISRINESKRTVSICTVLIFLTMLVLNLMTLMVADDYIYSFSFANTSERMTSLTQIIPSMVSHYDYMNGRVILHSIVQIILMFPTIAFDILNAAMFCGLILFVYYYCCVRILKRHNAFLLLVITAFVVKFTPAFGHVYLWLDGAVNYLWPTVIALAYIYPLIAVFDGKKVLKNVWKQGIYVVIGIFIGALSESLSMAVMGILFLFLMIQKFYKKEKIRIWIPLSLLTCMIGYLFMMLSPGTWKSKVEGGNGLVKSFVEVFEKYTSVLLWLIVLWIILVITAYYCKINRDTIVMSCLFMIVSVAINFLHITANRYPDRSMIGVTIFLIMADMILCAQFWCYKVRPFIAVIGSLSMFFALIDFVPGGYDILNVYRQSRAREEYILSERDKGNLELEVEIVKAETKYSAAYKLRYLKVGEWNDWPNVQMANYYGVNTITGKK